ncbi:flagellar basal body-associated FliL family protein [Celeribacter halophilus]|uniref:Flagellar protein FliL n=1 Tax=Celeribacter halophilus TaxID=576117 RepID=A0AAW7XXI0_9RHOB|nr:flagellar basal body-associated FliL family protein [Celeribacter halophilus]MDO6458386.1 flagellar basal body-associated FliL family protein [Celeribacter halophilus]MDO6724115.1 flagellar basal body-associated FliL family protein [Celeribacter halophilus]
MFRKILPVLLALFGLISGLGAGLLFRPHPEMVETDISNKEGGHDANHAHDTQEASMEGANPAFEYVKLNNQFVIPNLEEGRVTSMVVLTLSLETKQGMRESIYAREPKLRDAFLQVLFDHANTGGFQGNFTSSSSMTALRRALLEVARKTLGPDVNDVLLLDIVRQDFD